MEWLGEGIQEDGIESEEIAEAGAIAWLIAASTSSIFLLFQCCNTIVPMTTETHLSFLIFKSSFKAMASTTSRNCLAPFITLGASPCS
jgi:hypothetical protein